MKKLNKKEKHQKRNEKQGELPNCEIDEYDRIHDNHFVIYMNLKKMKQK